MPENLVCVHAVPLHTPHPLEELKIPKAKEGPSPKKDDGLQQS